MGYVDSLDIGNKAAQLCGAEQISSPTEDSTRQFEISFAYDKAREPELRRNTWRFATPKVALRAIAPGTMLLSPQLYSSTTTYLVGAVVTDANNIWWYSTQETNLNNTPGGNNAAWDAYFGPRTISPYDTTGLTSYYAGELVYVAGTTAGSYTVFMCLVGGTTEVPNVATAWSATVTYYGGQIISYGGSLYRSTSEVNLNITPFDGSIYLPYDNTAAYTIGNTVTGSDNFVYTALGSTTGNDPTTDGGVHWSQGIYNAWIKLAATAPSVALTWRHTRATMTNLVITYPYGSGPATDMLTRNAFYLPAGFLKLAPQDPKAGAISILGAPSGNQVKDWDLSGPFIVSMETNVIIVRFVANITKVTDMDPMFCLGLACQTALAVCEKLTQSTEKLKSIASEYALTMGEARRANAIEISFDEPPLDDYITCRL